MISPKVNPQARYSAVAEAVALADAEDRGEIQQAQNTDVNQQVIRRRAQQPRPLSTFINGSADSHNLNGHNETNQQVNSFQRRKARPASMAIIAPIEAPPQCFYCLGEATHCCNWCRVVYYCGPSHYNIHRCHSKCWPFKVKVDNDKGRCLVATKQIRRGDTILIDDAILSGPAPNSTPVCPLCLHKIQGSPESVTKCSKCQIPTCGRFECKPNNSHEVECRIFASNKVNIEISNFDNPNSIYSVIGPARLLDIRQKSMKNEDGRWRKLSKLPDHSDERKQLRGGEWKMFQLDVVDLLRDRCFMKNEISEDELNQIIGIFAVNSISLDNNKNIHGRALFPVFSMINHDCLSNSKFQINFDGSNNPRISVKARRDIEADEEITIQYTTSILGTHKRRKKLRSDYYFDCKCRRCLDVTECGTFVSAIVCEVCGENSQHYMLPNNPLDEYSIWNCSHCDFTLDVETVVRKVDGIQDEISEITHKHDTMLIEKFISDYSDTILHPNHYLLLLAKRNHLFLCRKTMIQLIATQKDSGKATEMKQVFKDKCELFKSHLEVLEKINCGSRS